jgi:hypothetical protein
VPEFNGRTRKGLVRVRWGPVELVGTALPVICPFLINSLAGMKTACPETADATRSYAVGNVINLVDPSNTHGPVAIKVVKPKSIRVGQKSQVVVAKLTSGVLQGCKGDQLVANNGSAIVAKFYDAKCASIDPNWPREPTPLRRTKDSQDAEKHAYEKLVDLQGSYIPEFYGEYRFIRSGTGEPDEVSVLLLQFVPDATLCTTISFSSSELEMLKSRALEIQQKIHANGVYHGDFEARNFLWNSTTGRLTLIDFDNATFNDWNYNPQMKEEEAQGWKASFLEDRERDDTHMLWSMLSDLGVEDERPAGDISFLIPPVL